MSDHRKDSPSQQMKIAFLIGQLGGGGAERQLALLARGLIDHGHHVEIWVYQPGGQYEAILGQAGKDCVVPILGRKTGPLARLMAVRRKLGATKVDIVFPYLEECCVFVSLGKPKRSRPRVVWGVRNSGVQTSNYPLKIAVLQFLAKRLAARADLVIFNSDRGRRFYKLVAEDKAKVIANGIDIERFRPPETEAEAALIRQKHNLEHDRAAVLFVGRNDPSKGISDLLLVASRLNELSPSTVLLVVGLDRGDLSERDELPGNVRFLGQAPCPEEVMRISNVLLSTSLREGFQNVVAEAIACGARVVATDVGSASRIVGNRGVVCTPGDVEAIARAVIEQLTVSNSLDERWIGNSLVSRRFGVDFMVQTTEESLLEVR